MNDSQKRKLIWIIFGIIVLSIFLIATRSTKNILLSPMKSLLPSNKYPTSPIYEIPGEDSWTKKIIDRMRQKDLQPTPTVIPYEDISCNSNHGGYVYKCDGNTGTVCVCEGSSCQSLELTCSNGCKEGPQGIGKCDHFRNP